MESTFSSEPHLGGEGTFTIAISEKLQRGEPDHFWITSKMEILIWKEGTTWRAVPSICPHMGAQLCHRKDHSDIFCPWHGLAYQTANLKSQHHRYQRLRPLTVREFEGMLQIKL